MAKWTWVHLPENKAFTEYKTLDKPHIQTLVL